MYKYTLYQEPEEHAKGSVREITAVKEGRSGDRQGVRFLAAGYKIVGSISCELDISELINGLGHFEVSRVLEAYKAMEKIVNVAEKTLSE